MTNDKIKELMEQSGLLSHLDCCIPGAGDWECMEERMTAFVKLVREETIRECATVCDMEMGEWGYGRDGRYAAKYCGERIRALLERGV